MLWLLILAISPATALAQSAGADAAHPGRRRVSASTADELAAWTRRIGRLVASGALVLRESRRGPDSRLDEWFVQHHRGVPVAGGDVWRRTEHGKVIAVEGTLYEDIAVDIEPGLTADQLRDAFRTVDPNGLGPSVPPRLVVLPTAEGSYVLAYSARLFADGALSLVYLDASTGRVVLRVDDPGPPASRAVSPVPRSAARDKSGSG